jgi:UDP-glucose 4-epimerase
MLTHHFPSPISPGRVVIVGGGGFVGAAAADRLIARGGVEVISVTRKDVDLLSDKAAVKLASMLRKSDTLVMVAAQAPVKSNSMLIDNLRMVKAVCEALDNSPVNHVVYISSDAVYSDSRGPLTEYSCAQPASLHGVMHLAREVMLANSWKGPLCLLRPTLIYGAGDPHNGYGPNRFLRLAAEGKEIVLFGAGEERRDHVWVQDVAEILSRVVLHRSTGILNIATGSVLSFRAIAEKVVQLFRKTSQISDSPRVGPMPHDGFRPFDITATYAAFSDFRYTPLTEGLSMTAAALSQND